MQPSPQSGTSSLCERVFGRDLGQHGYMNQAQLDLLLQVLQLDASHHGLDLGCGNGLIAEYVSDRTGAHITGLDYAELRPQINFTAPALQALFGNSAFDARMQAEQLGELAVSLAMIAPLLMLSYTRRDFFLIRGNLRAPIGGSRQALWMAAYFFGIAHYFGTPGGILGGMASIFMGWILVKGMVETRGLFWTWWIHFLSDIAIFLFLAAAMLQ